MNRLTNETGKVLVLCAAIVAATPISISAAETVNIYSYRQSGLLKPLLKDFTARTGIKTKVLFAKKGLDQRIAAEGRNPPADVLLTVDIGNLAAAAKLGITQPVSNSDIDTSYVKYNGRDMTIQADIDMRYAYNKFEGWKQEINKYVKAYDLKSQAKNPRLCA